jgi:hypothetical protein
MADAITTPSGPLPLGVFAETGARLPLIDDAAFQEFIQGRVETAAGAAQIQERAELSKPDAGLVRAIKHPNCLAETGWAVMYGPSVTPNIKKGLKKLLERRAEQAGDLFKIFEGTESYQPGDDADEWLNREPRGVPNELVKPTAGVPFYILIVAPPTEIPFDFQFGLDLNWAVGRLWFDNDEDAFRRYAESVVEYETAKSVEATRKMAIFAPQNGSDESMNLLCANLARPMSQKTGVDKPFGAEANFRLDPYIAEAARRETLDAILRGTTPGGRPAVLFTGSHGMRFLANDVRQADAQGAIVCDEWKGVGPPEDTTYLGANNLKGAKVQGLVHFMFNCYGCGWPKNDTYTRLLEHHPIISKTDMLAKLPQALLSHPNGGALAVLGHVDRSWSCSYSSKIGPQIEGFRGILDSIMAGDRIGLATDTWNSRWAQLSASLIDVVLPKFKMKLRTAKELQEAWIARDDARNYIVFGDPAVQLRTDLLK